MTPAGTDPAHLDLASPFRPAARGDWQRAVAAVLRRSGALADDAPDDAAEAALATTTYDGITVQPLYTADDWRGSSARPGGARGGWDVRALHAHPDPAVTARAALDDLENGATSLWLVVGANGVPLGHLGEALRGVHLDLAPVLLDAGADTAAAATEFLDLAAARGTHPEGANLGADPIGLQARTGAPADLAVAVQLAGRCAQDLPGVRAIVVDVTPYHEAGGGDADELGIALATGLAYVRALVDAGMTLEQAFDQLEFRFAASADQFLTIAKFRAARRVWARVGEVCGISVASGRPQRQHAVTSAAMMTRRDPWVNMLRTTLACFGAGVGGADAVTVRPFDACLGLPDDLARRIARNTSSLLVLEAHVAHVVDPAGGSWYVERLTDELASAGWARFTTLERAGGIVAALESGLVREQLAGVWSARAENIARRRDRLTGVSEFPHLEERLPEREPAPGPGPGGGGLPVRRYAGQFEDLRDAADAETAARGSRPAVFVAAIGPASAYAARVAFAANLFQAGGLATPTGSGGVDPAAIAAEFRGCGAAAAVLASSDRVYGEHAEAVAGALRAAGAQHLWLAGRPGRPDERPGVDGFVHTGVDAPAVLREAHAVVGIPTGTAADA